MVAWPRSRGVRWATRYQASLNSGCVTSDSRRPGPHLETDPVDRLPRPDPHERAAPDRDLADTFHARPQSLRCPLEPPLDAEVVVALARRRNRRDRLHGERHRVGRPRGQEELATLADDDVGDVALVDLQ